MSVVLLAAPAGRGQTTGSIAGRVIDAAGLPFAGVTVEATSPSLQGTRTVQTDSAGAYRFPGVPPGTYLVQGRILNFRTGEKKATVALDSTATVDLVMQPSAEEQVLVSGEAPLIDGTSTTTGTNYSSNVIGHLPVDRNYADIVRANPGVSTDLGVTNGRALALTIYGATSAENQWTIDGVNTTNVLRGSQGKVINNDFIEAVEVKTGGYQAEYGRALGGVISVVTKSGGNAFHGDGFVYYDSINTAARQQFKAGDSAIATMRVADGERFDYAIGLGGYLLKDRLWFFGAYNRVSVKSHVSRVQSATYVSKDDRFPFDGTDNFYSGKLTWNAGPSTSLVGTVFADPATRSGAAGADPAQGLGFYDVAPIVSPDPSTWYSTRNQGGVDYGIRLSQLFGSQMSVTLQGSFHRDRNTLTPPDGIRYEDDTCTGGTPDSPCDPPPEPNAITGGYGVVRGPYDHSVSSRAQLGGIVTLYSGNHEIRAGADYMDGRTDAQFLLTGGQVVTINSEFGQRYYKHIFWAVSPDDPTPVAPGTARARVLDYGAFVQDSWKVAQGLTVNVGLRWDGEDTHNYLGQTVLRFSDEWQPRIGVVWDPWRDGATKVYAFAGRFSYALPTIAAAMAFGNYTVLATYNFDPASVVQDPNVLGHEEFEFLQGGGPYGESVDSGIKGAYQDELTVGFERLLAPTFTVGLKATYRGLGRALEDRGDLDWHSPEANYSPGAFINPGSDGTFARGDVPTCNGLEGDWAQCGLPGVATPRARRVYRGIEILARQTIGDRAWLQASYVYSSLRGNYDGGVNEGNYDQAYVGWNMDFDFPAFWHNGYGILALDRPQRLRFDGYWVTPWGLGVGLQAFVESGAPLNKMGYFNGGYGSAVFLVPRGSVGRLPTLWGANLTLSYPIAIGPTIVTLQAYLFNLFNKQIAVSRNDVWSDSQPQGYPATIYDPNQEQTNIEYGKVTVRQEPFQFRAAVKVSF
ncbi:MAG TPA: carboxypeptidase regulatory-like domain-containing protein [Thermoanaerobaculia bacterium]|nr:carboxypeptidase regulatory-like domain-containing protein [Thermoanaerobaculia bacterium]